MTLAVSIAQSGANNVTMRNRIINGAMMIDQRNAGASVNIDNTGVYTLDRWFVQDSTDGSVSAQQSSTVPAGFKNSLLVTVTAADASIGATQYARMFQAIEGLNVSDLSWGTASAATVTLSFWVRASVTGTYGGSVGNSAADRTYPFTYTINNANTFEYKTITIPGDQSGTWLTTNGIGIFLQMCFAAGSTLSGTAGSWAAANYLSATGAVNMMATNGATFYITGVQLEKGTTATAFEQRLYGTELALCQRYYAKILSSSAGYNLLAPGTAASTSSVGSFISFPVTMRSGPTFSYANIILADGAVSSVVNSIGTVYAGNNTANVTFNGGTANLTLYRPTPVVANNTSAAYIDMTAEL